MGNLKTKKLILGLMALFLVLGCSTARKDKIALNIAKEMRQEFDIVQPEILTQEQTTTAFKDQSKIQPSAQSKRIFIKLNPLPATERLTYKAKYLGITVGEMTSVIREKTTYKNRPVIIFELTAKTTSIFSRMFKVEDHFVSYMDAENYTVLRHEEHRKEGKYQKDSVVDFDYVNKKAYFKNSTDGTTKTIDIPEQVHDILTANYYIRMVPWKLGDKIALRVYADESVYNIVGVINAKRSSNIVGIGKKTSYEFQPFVYKNNEDIKMGTAKAFFDVEDYKTPLIGEVKTPIFGSASITLHKIDRKVTSN